MDKETKERDAVKSQHTESETEKIEEFDKGKEKFSQKEADQTNTQGK